jgi:DNA repair protein RecO (recombination protein O)
LNAEERGVSRAVNKILTEFEPAFVLHTRPFRDTSLLVDLFTENHGRISVLARGVRKARSETSGLLMPFLPLLVILSGKGELLNLKKVEASGLAYDLSGKNLLNGFYLNELLVKLLPKNDEYRFLYLSYQQTLSDLQNSAENSFMQQKFLRIFERDFLEDIGYGLLLHKDINDNDILPEAFYNFSFSKGFSRILHSTLLNEQAHSQQVGINAKSQCTSKNTINLSAKDIFSGASILALYYNEFKNIQELTEMKLLMRQIFDHLLNGKEIKTRRLF